MIRTQIYKNLALLIGLQLLAACTQVPPITQSREVLWNQFGNQSVDNVLILWGPPAAETHLTNGTRIVTYRHITTYDAGSPYAHISTCDVSFLAPPPAFVINNISMQGDPNECYLLSQGRLGYTNFDYMPPPPPPQPFPPHYYYR